MTSLRTSLQQIFIGDRFIETLNRSLSGTTTSQATSSDTQYKASLDDWEQEMYEIGSKAVKDCKEFDVRGLGWIEVSKIVGKKVRGEKKQRLA
jgi:hypothetical protein